MRSSWRYFPLQGSRIPRRHLSGHEPIMRFISIRSTIGLLEQRRVCTPLNIDGIAHHKSVFGHYLQAAGASLRRWLNHLSEHLPQSCFTAHHLAIWTKELHILRKLRHQARPVTARERGHMFFHHLGRRGLAFERRHRLSNKRQTQQGQGSQPAGGQEREGQTDNFHRFTITHSRRGRCGTTQSRD
jgi:hypothetical protein